MARTLARGNAPRRRTDLGFKYLPARAQLSLKSAAHGIAWREWGIGASMKTKLEAIANVTVIFLAVAMGTVMCARYVGSYRTPHTVAAGDRLSNLPGLDWSHHRRTLLLVLNTGCHYCRDSVPFYQRLVQAQPSTGSDVELIVVFPNDTEAVGQLMKDERLPIHAVPAVPLKNFGITAFPTLLLVDPGGRVERSWVGLLTPRQELEVLSVVAGSTQDCSARELSAFRAGKNKTCGSGSNVESRN